MSSATPVVPPRPQARAQQQPQEEQQQSQQPAAAASTPLVPPRPVRKTDPSPDREAFTRSPLNGHPATFTTGRQPPSESRRLSTDFPPRPPSVALPSIGQEGSEYSSYDQLPPEAHGFSEQTKSVSADLPMHQPVASVSRAAAKRQIETVTRTDSTQAVAAGIVSPPPVPPENSLGRHTDRSSDYLPLRSKTSFSRSTSNLERTTSRPGSIHGGNDYEHGIPEIGKQVPLLAYAGDVQAPSPGPTQTQHAPGIGFFNDGSARNHTRKRSSRQENFHPDSYGLRHDADHQDQFERAWAAKHPEEAAREEHYSHLPRPESALSSEQLNRMVNHSNDVGFGTAPGSIGIPGEDVAFEASSEYTQSGQRHFPHRASGSYGSPGRHARSASGRRSIDRAMESEDEHTYHLKPPTQRTKKVTGGGDVDNKLDLDDGYISEHADGTPILASDEIIKRPGSAFMHAAIEPSAGQNEEYYDSDQQWQSNSRRNSVNPPSRPGSRPSSVHGNVGNYHGGPLHRFTSHDDQHHSGVGTPLEEIEEYEPLFPEDEKEGSQQKRLFKKRPELAGHHFPSQDIWEDTPDSLQYSAEVHTPDLEREQPILDAAGQSAAFETPEQEQQRRAQNPEDMTSSNKTFIKPHFKPSVLDDVHHSRPGIQRFPSSDVWEDSPDSYNLTTIVNAPQEDEIKSPVGDDTQPGRPTIPSRPIRSSNPADTTSPNVPAKPSIPARPVRDTTTTQRTTEPPAVPTKTKPIIPARPAGSKIASLQAGFMNDLNNRLKLGPVAPPKKDLSDSADDETDRATTAPAPDARKTRAKGPARRKPAAATPPEVSSQKFGFAMSPLITVWTIDEEDELQVQSVHEEKAKMAVEEAKENVPPSTTTGTDEEVGGEVEQVGVEPLVAPLAKREEVPNTTIDGAEGEELRKEGVEGGVAV